MEPLPTPDTLDTRVQAVLDELSLEEDWNGRYRLLVAWGEEAPALGAEDCHEDTALTGCSSPAWLKVEAVGGVLAVRGHSEGYLPRALLALTTRLFDGLAVPPTVPWPEAATLRDRLGLTRHLSPTRALALLWMFERALAGGKTSLL